MNYVVRASATAGMLAFSIASHAESAVTLYGIIDTGVDWENNVAAAPGQPHASGSAVRMTSLTATGPSRWGLRGKEDLGGGLSAVFALEDSFLPNSGALSNGGRLFGREAWIGLETPYGTFRFGRQYTMTFYNGLKTDILAPGLYSNASLDPYLANPRIDNALGYFGNFGPLVIGGTYSFGHDAAAIQGSNPANAGVTFNPSATNCPGGVPGNTVACREISALIGYWTKSVGMHVAYDEMRGGSGQVPGSSAYDGSNPILMPTSSDKTARYIAGGWFQIDNLKVAASVIHRKTSTSATVYESTIFNLGTSYVYRPDLVFDAQIARIVAGQNQNANSYVVRSTYFLSKRTAIYAAAAFMQNSSKGAYSVGAGYMTVPSAKQVGILLGMKTSF